MAEKITDPRDAVFADGLVRKPVYTAAEEGARATELLARTLNPIDNLGLAFTGGANVAVNLYNDFERKTATGEADPEWKPAAWLDANRERVPQDRQWRFMQTSNVQEAEAVLLDYNESAEANGLLVAQGGFTAFTAMGLAGLVDIDAPLAFLSGGVAAGAKASLLATKLGRMAVGGAVGAATGVGLMAADYTVNPNADWTSIPAAGLLGAAFGAVGGAMVPSGVAKEATTANNRAVDEFSDAVAAGNPMAERPIRAEAFPDANPYMSADAPAKEGGAPRAFEVPQNTGSSAGAAQANVPQWQANMADPDQVAVVGAATARWRQTGAGKRFEEAWERVENAAPGVAQAARVFESAVRASPLASVYSRLQNSPSYVAKMLGYDLMVSPTGLATNTKAAALLKVDYENQLRGVGIPAYTEAYGSWATAQGKGSLEREWSRTTKEAFDREVSLELQARRYDPMYDFRKSDPHVVKAADAHDAFSKRELEISQGRPGEGSVKGWEDIQWAPGYMAQRWSGSKMRKLISRGAGSKQAFIDLLKNSYLKQHPNMDPADAAIYATAVVQRAMTSERGVNTNLIGILQEDGTDYLFQTLTRNGVSQADASSLIDKLTSRLETKSQQGQTKQRIDVDLRETDASGIMLMDIIDTNLMDNMARRARGTAGRAALARKGIYSPQDRDKIISTILNEQMARKGVKSETTNLRDKVDEALHDEKDLTIEELQDYFTYFGEGPVGGGISPGYSRAMKLTNLALLNGLGLTQLAENGVMIGAFGWEKFLHFAGDSLKSSLGKGDSELVKELTHMHIFAPEHRLYRDDMTHEFERGPAQSEFWGTVDHALNQGQRLQGYMSGFYKIKEWQQRIAVTAGADKIMRGLLAGKGLTSDRLEEIGLTKALQARLNKYIQNGTVEFKSPDGTRVLVEKQLHLHKLNFDQWSPEDVEEFTAVMNIVAHRQVQKGLAGETSMIFHKDGLLSLFLHLKSFPLLAMSKQTLRHARIADSESIASLMYGLMTAGAVYSAKQAINGNGEDLDPVKVMKGAFGMSNLTGWFPMFSDPVASLLGMDNLKFNEYSRGIDGNVVTAPAAFPTINKMLNVPGALLSPATAAVGLRDAAFTNNDINALKSTPIIGNYYGMTALLNAVKEVRRAPPTPLQAAADKRAAPAAPDLPAPIQALLQ